MAEEGFVFSMASKYVLLAYGFPGTYEVKDLEDFVRRQAGPNAEIFLHIRWLTESKALLSFNSPALGQPFFGYLRLLRDSQLSFFFFFFDLCSAKGSGGF